MVFHLHLYPFALVGPMVLPGARMMTEEQVMQLHEGLRLMGKQFVCFYS